MRSQTPGFPFRASKSAGGAAEVSAVVVVGDGGDDAGGGTEVSAVVVAGGGGEEAGGGTEFAAVLVAGGGGDDAGGGAEVAAVVVVRFAFVRAAGGFMAASSAMTGSGVKTVVGAMPESPDCMELDSFTAMRTGTLCG
jgi:hypothetical protein